MNAEELARVPDVVHPMIRQHADGRCSVFLGGHASHIEGEPVAESRAQYARWKIG